MENKDQVNQQAVDQTQKFKITVQGEEKEIPLKELLELAQKGDDYTRKTQELSEREKKAQEDVKKQAEELAYQYIEEQQKETEQAKPEVDDTLDPQEKRIRQLEDAVKGMKKGSDESEVKRLELQFETQIKDLKGKYPDMNEQVVIATLMANPDLDMAKLAKDSHEGLSKQRDAWIKDYLDGKKQQPKTEGGGPSTLPIEPKKDLTGKDLSTGEVKRQAADAVRQELQE